MKLLGTNLSLGETFRLVLILCGPPYILIALLIYFEWMPTPKDPIAWIATALAGPAVWGSFLSAVVDTRTLLGRPRESEVSIKKMPDEISQIGSTSIHEAIGGGQVKGDTVHFGSIKDSGGIAIGSGANSTLTKQGPIFTGSVGNANTVYAEQYYEAADQRTALSPSVLPSPVQVFEGRDVELDRLLAYLMPNDRTHQVLVCGIRGMGGVGKTELILQAAHRLASFYPDAQLFIECQTDETPLTSETLLGRVISALQPDLKLPEGLSERQVLARQLMSGKRGILVLDNVASGEQVYPLLSLSTGWALAITSRHRFTLRDAMLVDLEPLAPTEAEALLIRLLQNGGRSDIVMALFSSNADNASDSTLRELANLCGYLPLALRIAAGFLCNIRDWSLVEYLQALDKARLRYLRIEGEQNLQAVLGISVTHLDSYNKELGKRWRKLAVFPGPFDRVAASGVWGTLIAELYQVLGERDGFTGEFKVISLGDEIVRDVLSSLVQHSLINYDASTHTYSMHSLLREYALQVQEEEELGETWDTVYRRFGYHCVLRGGRLATMYRRGSGQTPDLLREFDHIWPQIKVAWDFHQEKSNLAAKNWIAQFSTQLADLLDVRLKASERLTYYAKSAEAANELNYKRFEAMNLGNLGNTYLVLNQLDAALAKHKVALELHRELGDIGGQIKDLMNIGAVYTRRGDAHSGIKYTEEALALSETDGDLANQCASLINLGALFGQEKKFEASHTALIQALDISRNLQHKRLEAGVLAQLGGLLAKERLVTEAQQNFEQALTLSQEVGDRRLEASILGGIGDLCIRQGRYADARNYLERSLSLSRVVEDRNIEATALAELADIHFTLDEFEGAATLYEQLLDVYKRANRCDEMVSVWEKLNTACQMLQQSVRGTDSLKIVESCFESALADHRQRRDRLGEGICVNDLGVVCLLQGNIDKSIEHFKEALTIVRELDAKQHEVLFLTNLASAFEKREQHNGVRASVEEAARIARSLADEPR